MSLTNSVTLVTGGSGGLGSRICSLLATESSEIAVGFHSGKQRAESVRDAILDKGGKSIIVQLDQSDPVSINRVIAQVVEQLGSLDILVNNAAMASGGHDLPLA